MRLHNNMKIHCQFDVVCHMTCLLPHPIFLQWDDFWQCHTRCLFCECHSINKAIKTLHIYQYYWVGVRSCLRRGGHTWTGQHGKCVLICCCIRYEKAVYTAYVTWVCFSCSILYILIVVNGAHFSCEGWGILTVP